MTHAEFEALVLPPDALARPALIQDEWRPDLYGIGTRDYVLPAIPLNVEEFMARRKN